MSACCGDQACAAAGAVVSPRFRKALWVALVINAIMFAVEIVAGMRAGSMSLFADALDFASDAANYGITLAALSLGVVWRARAAWVKGASMFAFGLFVIVRTAWAAYQGHPPEPFTMGAVAFLALLANGGVALMLYAFRAGDANMRSVWLCSRNDAIGNLAVMLAAAGVFGTGQGWPDLAVAAVMAGLALSAGWSVMRQAARELANVPSFSPPKLVTIAIDNEIRRRPR